jgi:hypothetical protein
MKGIISALAAFALASTVMADIFTWQDDGPDNDFK